MLSLISKSGITQLSLLQACCTMVAEVGEEHQAIHSDVFPSLVDGQHQVMQFVLFFIHCQEYWHRDSFSNLLFCSFISVTCTSILPK